MICVECALESCFTCANPDLGTMECCCGGEFEDAGLAVPPVGPPPASTGHGIQARHDGGSTMHDLQEIVTKGPVGRIQIPDDELSNPTKGGRLRAQRAYKIEPGTICQWAGLRFAGGGIRPIIGCDGRPAKARHHGPDKSTTTNQPNNVHLICASCHNRWHTENDKFYGDRPTDGGPFTPRPDAGTNHPHDSNTKAADTDLWQNEIYWNTPKAKRDTLVFKPWANEEDETLVEVAELKVPLDTDSMYATMDIDEQGDDDSDDTTGLG